MLQGGFAVVSYRPGAHGEGPDGARWSISDSVSVVRIVEEQKARDLADARNENNWRSAVVSWGDDLIDTMATLDQIQRPDPVDNYRIRIALGLPVRYFQCADDGCNWWVVAVNQDHAEEILKRNCDSFGQEGVPFGLAKLVWSEVATEQAAAMRCHREDAVDPVPLSHCNIGECFSTEW